MRLVVLIAFALLAFAGNSLLTRAALADPQNAPLAFATLRLLAGALVLFFIAAFSRRAMLPEKSDVFSASMLLVYALAFSFAYVAMGAATGALILFSVVQLTMIAVGLARGQALTPRMGVGLALAIAGLAWLLSPGLSAPPWGAALLMATAGVAWGLYSASGQKGGDPIARTTRNFIGSAIPAILMFVIFGGALTQAGALLAIASGAATSALGYVLWYLVLPKLSSYAAASLQLSVPIIAMAGSFVWLGEAVTLQFILASLAIIAGIALTIRRT